MSIATIGGASVTRCRVQVPRWGCPWIDADLAGEVALSGAVTLKIADVSVSGTVVSGGTHAGRSAYRIVGGAGGWGKLLPEKPYSDDAGVRVSNILQGAATEAGETISGLPTTRLGPHYARRADLASSLLNQLAPKAWRVTFDGVTRLGAYPESTYTGADPRTSVQEGARVLELTPEKLAPFLPGVVIDGHPPASDVEYDLTEDRLTARVYFASAANRAHDAIRRIIMSLFPSLPYAGTFEYRVVLPEGNRFHLQPVRRAHGLPDLPRVPMCPGLPGWKVVATPGALVLVTFADNDPSRPRIFAWDHPDSPGWNPLFLEFGPAGLPVAFLGSPVVAGPFGGTVVGGAARLKVSPA